MKNPGLFSCIGKTISVVTVCPQVLGDTYNNLVLKGVHDYTSAAKYSAVLNTSAMISATGVTVVAPEEQVYFQLFEPVSGDTLYLADDWIKSWNGDGEITIQFTLTLPDFQALQALNITLTERGWYPKMVRLS